MAWRPLHFGPWDGVQTLTLPGRCISQPTASSISGTFHASLALPSFHPTAGCFLVSNGIYLVINKIKQLVCLSLWAICNI